MFPICRRATAAFQLLRNCAAVKGHRSALLPCALTAFLDCSSRSLGRKGALESSKISTSSYCPTFEDSPLSSGVKTRTVCWNSLLLLTTSSAAIRSVSPGRAYVLNVVSLNNAFSSSPSISNTPLMHDLRNSGIGNLVCVGAFSLQPFIALLKRGSDNRPSRENSGLSNSKAACSLRPQLESSPSRKRWSTNSQSAASRSASFWMLSSYRTTKV